MASVAEDFRKGTKDIWPIDYWQAPSPSHSSSKDILEASEWIVEEVEQVTSLPQAVEVEDFFAEYPTKSAIQLKQVEELVQSFDRLTYIQRVKQDSTLKNRFEVLATKWQQETCGFSSITKKITNLNYLKIIALGEAVVPLILNSLAQKPDHWFIALKALTDQDPTKPGDSFEQAVEAWLNWGREKRLIN